MLGYLKRGAQRLAQSAAGPLRGDLTGALVTTDAHARYQEAVLSGNVWIGANPAGTPVATQGSLSATTPPLTLLNPINSPVNLVLWEFQFSQTAIVAGVVNICLAYNMLGITGVATYPLTVTNAQVTNALLAMGQPQGATAVQNQGAWGQCYRVCTLNAAPVAFRYPFNQSGSSALTMMNSVDHIDGAIVIPPGIAISVQSITTAITVMCAFVWEEIPISN